jgi:hypothetical protein
MAREVPPDQTLAQLVARFAEILAENSASTWPKDSLQALALRKDPLQWLAAFRSGTEVFSGKSEPVEHDAGLGPTDMLIADSLRDVLSGRNDLKNWEPPSPEELSGIFGGMLPASLQRILNTILITPPGDEILAIRSVIEELTTANDEDVGKLTLFLQNQLGKPDGVSFIGPAAGLGSSTDILMDFFEATTAQAKENLYSDEVREENAALISAMRARIREDSVLSDGLDLVLADMAHDPAWHQLHAALNRILQGERSPQIFQHLSAEDHIIVTAILDDIGAS